MTERLSAPAPDEVDARLRNALADDLPDEVQTLLEGRFDRELERRRAAAGETNPVLRVLSSLGELVPRSPVLVRLAVPAALVLLVSGALLEAGGPGSRAAGPVGRLNVVASVSHSIRLGGPLLCPGRPGLEGLSSEELSRRVYRTWVLVEAGDEAGSGVRLLFRALDEPGLWELDVDPGTYRPRRLRRVSGAGAPRGPGSLEGCEWSGAPAAGPGEGRS